MNSETLGDRLKVFVDIVDAAVVSIYDGDTFTVNAHTWPGLWVRTAVRVASIDTPEIKGKCDEERELARRYKDFATAFVTETA